MSLDHVIAISHDFAEAQLNRGMALFDLKRNEEALACFDRALAVNPDYAAAHNNRAILFLHLEQPQAALASCERTLRVSPHFADAYFNRGVALQALQRFDEALKSYERAIEIAPGYVDAHRNLSACRLLLGDFGRGWEEYEWRWKTEELKDDRRDFPQPLWLGEEDLAGATILLHAEQGIGDTLQFCRYASLVAALGAKVVLVVQAPLLPFLAGVEGASLVLPMGAQLPAFDYHCPLLSLPLAFRTGLDAIPAGIPYLYGDSSLVEKWRERLGEKTRPRVGLVWSGNPKHKNDHNRSIPLARLAPLFGLDLEFFSLQKEVPESDAELLVSFPAIRHLGAELTDFSDTAAVVELMDVVVSVDTSVAHLAGAMGKRVWILLPHDYSDWRWLLDRDDSPWYPTARLFRQENRTTWDEVIDRVVKELGLQFPASSSQFDREDIKDAPNESRSPELSPARTMEQAQAAYQCGEMDESERLCRSVLVEDADDFDALQVLGIILAGGCRYDEAAEVLSRAVTANPASASAHSNRGNVLQALRRPEEAVASYDRAIELRPEHAEALNNRGAALVVLERYEEALDSYESAIAVKADYAQAWSNRGNALRYLKRYDDAVASYDVAVAIKPDYAEAWHYRGSSLQNLKRLEEALASIERGIEIDPGSAPGHYDRGNMLDDLKRHEEALASYDRALTIEPDYAEAWSNRGNVLKLLARFEESVASLDQAIALNSEYAEAHNSRGAALTDLARHEEALASYERAIEIRPGYANAHYNRGNGLHALKRHEAAVASYDRAIEINPCFADAHRNRGNALRELKQYEAALASYDRAIAIAPDCAEAHNNRGIALQDLRRHDEALASYGRAIEINLGYAEAYFNRGNALRECERYEVALASYERAIEIAPEYAQAYNNRGIALQDLRRNDEALESYDRALAIEPEYADVYCNRGNALRGLKRFDEAIGNYDRAIQIKPDHVDGHNNRGVLLLDMKQPDMALESYEQALKISTLHANPYFNRGVALQMLKRHDEALTSFGLALEIRPEGGFVFGHWLHAKMKVCDWTGLPAAVSSLVAAIGAGKEASLPFHVLGLSDCPTVQRKAAEIWLKGKAPASDVLPALAQRARGAKIRIGYFSADYHNHATAYLMAELFERHDRSQFELIAFSFGPSVEDAMRVRVAAAFDQFIEVGGLTDREVAQLSRDLGVDIAVDLKGFTEDSRPGIFAYRAAPIQVNYLGYPGTMGVDYIDYLIADPTLIPEESRRHYSEKIAYLPHSYQVNDGKRRISDRVFTREELGLPAQGFVFCCFNNNYKITPEMFDVWMRLLKRVEGSVLWLLEDNPGASRNLRKEAQARGVDAARLVFAGRLPLDEHLARHRLADLFLDTLPCNAHTTASDALWAGLPVLTIAGEAFASRVAASLLNAIGLPELVTTTQNAYEALALELATQPERIRALRQKLMDNRLSAPLFDTGLFTRHIEDAYRQMFERDQAGLSPEHFHVAA